MGKSKDFTLDRREDICKIRIVYLIYIKCVCVYIFCVVFFYIGFFYDYLSCIFFFFMRLLVIY